MCSRAAWIAAVLLGLFPACAHAQGSEDRRVGLFFGYTFSDDQNPDPAYSRYHLNGGYIGVYVAQTPWLRWRVDGTVSGSILGPDDSYVFGGPEFTGRVGRMVFFAHALAGYGEVDGGLFNSSVRGFAMAFGGGADIKLNSRLSLRLIDADYLPSYFGSKTPEGIFGYPPAVTTTGWNNNSRVSFGLIVKFGPKL